MEFYPKDDLDISFKKSNIESKIQQVYSGTSIFLTGSTGFVGKFILEKLLRSCNVAQVYILVRPKKGKSSNERIENFFSDVFFERVLIENKNARNLITLIEGDLSLPDLGLSPENIQILHDEIDFVFHSAASINMMEHLRLAFNINVNATKVLLEQAKLMKKLKGFIYVSTAYAHAMLNNIEEIIYPTKYHNEEIYQIVNACDDNQLTAITPLLLEDCPNTYTFTKALAENLVSTYYPEIPVAVVRPSQIVSSVFEPIKGYVDNIYGPIGIALGTLNGFLKVWRCDGNSKLDIIPVDFVVNSILSIGWNISSCTSNSTKKMIPVFNLVASKNRLIPINENRKIYLNIQYKEGIYFSHMMGNINIRFIKNKSLYWIYFLLLHVIPLCFIDFGFKLFGHTRRLLPMYRRIFLTNKLLAHFSTKDFNFSSNNAGKLWSLMNMKDKEIFNFDQNSFTLEEYARQYIRGVRVYFVKDPMSSLPYAKRRYQSNHCLVAALYWMGMIGVTGGNHRLWSHRTYKANLPLRSLLMFFSITSFQKLFRTVFRFAGIWNRLISRILSTYFYSYTHPQMISDI